ncbi:carboxypeptidase regulatory-like domain-containing protein [Polynucleobacter sp. 15G-AUS-farblos]|uniref:carboxypeptidase-like regulatory domain-containing protein n=1 Tax=Polynucleobacter sp. 15G-AUS-farblos TaxID=2689094 RepID=UPI001C0B458A|nr:carboxypeptidase-like regulatory domain-containing protein [Polynucleobacter sp. 15G-AUS-farblos]MBU3582877.1 carboxypeptidase regulatory-like domain-containing protein [Polynucleobacter sp. 15G-AUS-farblos]
MKTLIRSLALVLCLLSGSSVWAQIPQTQYSQGISYITGGVGEEESTAILTEAKQWPVLLELSQLENGRGVWIFGSQIKILNAQNAVVFDAKAEGPYMLINLTAGDYAIQASYQGVEQKRSISVKAGQSQKISIFWK